MMKSYVEINEEMGINRQIRSARWGCILQFEIGWPMKALKKATFKKLPSGEASCEDIWRRWYRQRETKVRKTYFKLRIIRLTHSWLQQLDSVSSSLCSESSLTCTKSLSKASGWSIMHCLFKTLAFCFALRALA